MCPTKKTKFVMLLIGLLFIAVHWGAGKLSVDAAREVYLVCSSFLLSVCAIGSLLLVNGSQNGPPKRILGLQLLLTGLAAGFSILRILIGAPAQASPQLGPGILILGNVYAFIMLLYPIELLTPKRMTAGQYLKLFIPAILPGLFYYAYIRLTGTIMTGLDGWRDLLPNIHRFDVWFRFTLLIYPLWMLASILQRHKRGTARRRDNFSSTGDIRPGWIEAYLFGFFILLLSYTIVMLQHKPQNVLAHGCCILVFFCFTLYRILQQEIRSRPQTAKDRGSEAVPAPNQPRFNPPDRDPADIAADKYRFVDKIPEYKIMLERWMAEKKPYLNKEFKLIDVMQVLPLNRSYLSRMFNEAYGESFFSFVMRYRIEESRYLLESRPDLTVARIARICGFSSASVFGRAFLKNAGMTPKEYRNSKLPAA